MNLPNLTLDSDGQEITACLCTHASGNIGLFQHAIHSWVEGKKYDYLEAFRKSARRLAEELKVPLNETAQFRAIAEEIDGEEESSPGSR